MLEPMLKVVIDTNLLVNGSTDDYSFANRIIDEVIAAKIIAYANHATLRENKLLTDTKVRDTEYLKKMQNFFSVVNEVARASQLIDIVEDPDDNKLVESAAVAKADYLISSDRHLLKLEQYLDTKIVSPENFWNIYEEESGTGWQDWIGQFVK